MIQGFHLCHVVPLGEAGWISMSLSTASEQISLTFSSPLVTAVCQKSTASVCHCHRPRPSRAIWEAALQRTPEIASECRRKYHRVWHATQHTLPLGYTTVGTCNVCIHMKCKNIVYSSKTFTFMGKIPFWFGGGVIFASSWLFAVIQSDSHIYYSSYLHWGVWYHWFCRCTSLGSMYSTLFVQVFSCASMELYRIAHVRKIIRLSWGPFLVLVYIHLSDKHTRTDTHTQAMHARTHTAFTPSGPGRKNK